MLPLVVSLPVDGPWNRSEPKPEVAAAGENWAHIGNLTAGEEYYFRVVAVNGLAPETRETRSHPPWRERVGIPHGASVFIKLLFCSRIFGYAFVFFSCGLVV